MKTTGTLRVDTHDCLSAAGAGFRPGGTGFQPGGTGLRPGGTGFQPGGTGFQPVCLRCASTAFSLAELMIAIAVLGVGMAMVAALFPAAISQAADSGRSTLGGIVCRNALALAVVRVRAGDVTNTDLEVLADESRTSILALDQQRYPQVSGGAMGFVLLGRRRSDAGDYQLVSIAYHKRSGGVVTARSTSCSVAPGGVEVTGASGLRVGSPLIDVETGGFARIVSINPAATEGRLDRPIHQTRAVSRAMLVVESGCDILSPAIATMTTRTGLEK